MKSIVKRISRLFGGVALVAIVMVGALSTPIVATATTDVCTAPLDVVLVFDRSSSMTSSSTMPNPQPLNDAQDATVAFIHTLNNTDDLVGLVDFENTATLTNVLTVDHAAVISSVEIDWIGSWTNTGAGIDAGHAELSSVRGRDGVKKVMILLSDGNPTKPTSASVATTYAYEQANEAKADGVIIYTIGFGNNVDETIMREIASGSGLGANYYFAPTSGDLEAVYMALAEDVCEPNTVTLTSSKIVCEDESLLPNWSGQSINITETTATDYVSTYQGCSLVEGWSFQWGDQTVSDPGGDYYGEVIGSGWTTFGSTDVSGVVSTSIDITGMTQIRVREVLQDGYIPFTYPGADTATSAEMYCETDVLHYDNFDFVTGLTTDETYYCVAFNAPEETYECSDGIDNDGDTVIDGDDLGCDGPTDDDENDAPVITVNPMSVTRFVGDSFDPYNAHATADDAEDGDITGSLVASGTVDTNTIGAYSVDYDVVDSDGLAAATKSLTVNVVLEPPHYGPYCGDGIVNQWWEICDSGDDPMIVGCSVMCQPIGTPVCSEDVFARAVVTDVQNVQAGADMTEDIFLSTHVLPIPSGAWFPVYYDGSYVNDTDINAYEDVPGLALQRLDGAVTIRHYGTHPNDGTKEHVEGQLEFYNAGDLSLSNDTSGNNRMENWGPNMFAQKTLSAGKDAAWASSTPINVSNFWMTVTTADDSYFTNYVLPPVCEDPVYICSDGIDNDTDGLTDEEDPGCWTDTNDSNTYDPTDDDEYNEVVVENEPPVADAGSDQTVTIGGSVVLDGTASYDTDGVIISYGWDLTTGDIAVTATTSYIFTATGTYSVILTVMDNDSDFDTDTVNITVEEEEIIEGNQKPVITLMHSTLSMYVGNAFDPYGSHATANDAEDGDITSDIIATSTVNTSVVGTYSVEYGVEDSEGLAADPKTLTVIVSQPGGGGCTSNCGGGYVAPTLYITNEDVEYLGNGEAKVTWTTNLVSTSQVVYGDGSITSVGGSPLYGYDSMTDEDTGLTKLHSMIVDGLVDGQQYWFRPVSDNSVVTEKYGDEVTYTFVTVPSQCNYLLEFIQLGAVNNPVEVEKLEVFLNDFEGENLEVNGVYEQVDFEAVERFQTKYFGDILGPWGHDAPTGYVYITTKKKINELYCQREFPLSVLQESEIEAFSAFLEEQAGLTAGGLETEDVDFSNVVGLGDGETLGGEDTTLADATEPTETEGVDGTESRGLLAGILNAFGFGDNGENIEKKSDSTESVEDTETVLKDETDQGQNKRNLAAVVFGGVISVATSYWFIFLLAVFATILFLRIRGAERG